MRNKLAEVVFEKDEIMLNVMESLEKMCCLHVDIIIDIACTIGLGKNETDEIPMTLYYAISRIPLGVILAHRKRKDLKLVITYIENKLLEMKETPTDVLDVYKLISSLKEDLNNEKYDKV